MPAYIDEKDEKHCNICETVKPVSEFWSSRRVRKDGTCALRPYCIDCGTQKRLEVYYNKGGKEKQQARALKHKLKRYGVGLQDYEQMLKQQDGKCAICGTSEVKIKNRKNYNLYVDHCHTSNKVRGLLCNHCNTGLGMFKDSIHNLQKAQDYLNDDSLGYRDHDNTR